jgi:hypothetical protein
MDISTIEDLCARCKEKDLDEIFRGPSGDDWGADRSLMDLGLVTKEQLESKCALCRLFAQNVLEGDDQYWEHRDAATTFEESHCHLRRHGRAHDEAQDPATVMFLAVNRGPSPLETRPESHGTYQMRRSLLAIPVSSTTESLSNYHAREIHADKIDFDVVRRWIAFCEQHHQHYCSLQKRIFPRDIRLIDCETSKIVNGIDSFPYVALSYIWGQPTSDAQEVVYDVLPDQLPQTIEGAITVTKRLGFQYLWIDRFCILQHSQEDMGVQIYQMDLVYGNAELTIVAAVGCDPSFGLPGVGNTHRLTQSSAKVPGRTLVATLQHPTLASEIQYGIRGAGRIRRGTSQEDAYISPKSRSISNSR